MSNSGTHPGPPAPAAPGGEVLPFELVRNGYHPDQVRAHIAGLKVHIRALEAKLADFGSDVARSIGDIVRSPQGERLIADLMKLAADEIAGQQEAAAAEVEKILADARSAADSKVQQASHQAVKVLANAESSSASLLAGARDQADTILAGVRADAKKMLDSAAARAAAVHEGAERRLAALVEHHEETRRRLAEISDVTHQVLSADGCRGSLRDEVSRATAAVSGSSQPELGPGSGPASGEPGPEKTIVCG